MIRVKKKIKIDGKGVTVDQMSALLKKAQRIVDGLPRQVAGSKRRLARKTKVLAFKAYSIRGYWMLNLAYEMTADESFVFSLRGVCHFLQRKDYGAGRIRWGDREEVWSAEGYAAAK